MHAATKRCGNASEINIDGSKCAAELSLLDKVVSHGAVLVRLWAQDSHEELSTEEVSMARILKAVLSVSLSIVLAVGVVLSPAMARCGREWQQGVAYAAETAGSSENSATGNDISEDDIQKAIEALKQSMRVADIKESSGFWSLVSTLSDYGSMVTPAFSFISGGMTLLQMFGLTTDANGKRFEAIQAKLLEIQSTLSEMSVKLDNIAKALTEIKTSMEVQNKGNIARQSNKNWNDFNTNYIEPMYNLVIAYQDDVVTEMRTWCKATKKSDFYIFFGEDKDGNRISLYVANSGVPEDKKADSGETITGWVKIPASQIAAGTPKWNADTYPNDIAAACEALIKQSDTLSASKNIKAAWKKMTAEQRAVEAKVFGKAAYDTLAYKASCKVATDSSKGYGTKFKTAWTDLTGNLIKADSSLDACFKSLFNTCNFEAEAKDSINAVCDDMIVRMGAYGTLCADIMKKSEICSSADIEQAANSMYRSINYITEMRNKALTGHDNYCYSTNSLVVVDFYQARNVLTVVEGDRKYSATGWKMYLEGESEPSVFNTVGEVNTNVIYILGKNANWGGTNEFQTYLNTCGVLRDGKALSCLATRCPEEQTYSASEQEPMQCYWTHQFNAPRYLKDKVAYDVFSKKSGYKEEFLKYKKKLVASMFDCVSGAASKQTVAACCFYDETHLYWGDNYRGYAFARNWWDNVSRITKEGYPDWDFTGTSKSNTFATLASYPVLSDAGNSVQTVASDAFDEDFSWVDPIGSFNACQIVEKEADPEPEPQVELASIDGVRECAGNPTFDDETTLEAITTSVDTALEAAAVANGSAPSLTTAQRTDLTTAVQEELTSWGEQIYSNVNLVATDPFGIEGDEATMLKLAQKVLPSTYFDENGNLNIPLSNVFARLCYEPTVKVSFDKGTNGAWQCALQDAVGVKAVLYTLEGTEDDVNPTVFDISDETIAEMGLSMNVNLPVASTTANTTAVAQYADSACQDQLASFDNQQVQGAGANRYTQVSTNKQGVYLLSANPTKTVSLSSANTPQSNTGATTSSSKSSAKTGDDLAALAFGASILALAAVCSLVLRRKQRNK